MGESFFDPYGSYDVIKIETTIKNLIPPSNVQTSSPTEVLLNQMETDMRAMYDKYFGSYLQLNYLLVVALILDPRFKLRHVTHLLIKQLLEVDAHLKTKEIRDVLDTLYKEYAPRVDLGERGREGGGAHEGPHTSSPPRESSSTSFIVESFEDDSVDDWVDFVEDNEEQVVGDEVDSYLLDPLENVDKETKGAFKILSW